MTLRLKAEGTSGSVRVGGREAAALGAWQLRPADDGWQVRAAVRERNDLWLDSGGPFELRLELGTSEWRFRNVAVAADQTAAVITGTSQPEE